MANQGSHDSLPILTPLMGFSGTRSNDALLSALLQIVPFSPLLQSSNLSSLNQEHKDALLEVLQEQGGDLQGVLTSLLNNKTQVSPEPLEEEVHSQAEDKSETLAKLAEVVSEKETELKSQHAKIDQEIDSLQNTAVAQSEVMILCPRGGSSGARMYLHNPLERAIQLTFDPQMGSGVPESLKSEIGLDFEPNNGSLEAGSTTSMRLQVNLASHADWQSVDEISFHVNALASNRTVSTIWVTIKLVD